MDTEKNAHKKFKESDPELNKKKGARYSAKFKADLVKKINVLWGDGAKLYSACEAYNITHNTYWVWRNESEELREHFEKENMRRHKVRAERLRFAAYEAIEFLLTPEKRQRSIKIGKPDKKGAFQVSQITTFDEFRDPQWPAVLKALQVYASDEFNKELDDRTIHVVWEEVEAKKDSQENKIEEEE
jgi:hypothetical protein